ncbi:MAG: 2Fe-2S iron-sulfur cluster binding domain-containing protein [Acidiphilium sp.]|nr:2Fe-2S iron-sulfur cluster binding domain-containing protein [Acidiphilium sp.]MDD4936412.1 2Fe-2S iron-sulfur cluster binding domain-containing protein [Acidiphilium sp.]
MNYVITARFMDDKTIEFDCAEDENILAAALRQNLQLICQCKKAYCGSCKALCSDGDYEFGERINIQVLPSDEEEKGIVVTCDTFPRSDLVLDFSYTSDRLGEATVPEISAKVVGLERLSETVFRLELQAIDAETSIPTMFDFVPGQYVEIGIPGTDQVRAFSLANLPNEQGLMEFLIRLVPGGSFCGYLEREAAVGQIAKVRGPLGEFVCKAGCTKMEEDFRLHETGRVQAFVGGSTGLAPLVCMLRNLASHDYAGECHLFFGMQNRATMFYEKELAELAASMPNLTLHLALMEGSPDWQGAIGHSVGAFEAHFTGVEERPEVYLCGPPPMVAAAVASCARLGIPSDQVHQEEFVASGG